MISLEEASRFLEETLKLPRNWKATLDTDPFEFLRIYMRHHAIRIPFQNVTMAAVDVDKRTNPTESEVISQGLSGIGGCCLNLNYFTKIVLQAIGLEAFAIQGNHFAAPVPGTHCMTLVKLTDGLYLIEVGGQFPLLEPIPMQKLPFKILSAGGFPYEFREVSPGIVGRFQIGGGLFGGAYEGKTEALRTSWPLTPKKFSDFDHPMKETFTNPPVSVLLRNPMMCRYLSPEEYNKLFPSDSNGDNNTSHKNEMNGHSGTNNSATGVLHLDYKKQPSHFVFVFKRRIVIGDAFSRKIILNFNSYEEIGPEIKKYFPTLGDDEIEKAMHAFNRLELIVTPYDFIL